MDLLPPTQNSLRRNAGVEWIRAAGGVLVVMLHAGMPYLTHPLPGLIWATDSSDKSQIVNALCWGIDGFIMPLFFLMSGYFAAQLFRQRGPAGFLKHRYQRLGIPLLLALVVILPIDLYIWVLGWIDEERVPWRTLWRLSFPDHLDASLWGFSHLWYLVYLLIYCLSAWGMSLAFHRGSDVSKGQSVLRMRDSIWDRLPSATGLITLSGAGLIAGTVLWWQPRIVIGFRNFPFPLWENLVYYAVPFFLGWCWKQQESTVMSRHGGLSARWLLTGAVLLGITLASQLKWHLENEAQPALSSIPPVLFAFFGIVTSVGLFKLALSANVARVPVMVGYVAKGSFWIYLVHHPLGALINIAFRPIGWPPLLEFALTVIGVLGISLLMYEVGVRRTRLGLILNGVQEPPLGKISTKMSEEPEQRSLAA